ncbi:hypothetical protein [Nonomuraea sp. KM90]
MIAAKGLLGVRPFLFVLLDPGRQAVRGIQHDPAPDQELVRAR